MIYKDNNHVKRENTRGQKLYLLVYDHTQRSNSETPLSKDESFPGNFFSGINNTNRYAPTENYCNESQLKCKPPKTALTTTLYLVQ